MAKEIHILLIENNPTDINDFQKHVQKIGIHFSLTVVPSFDLIPEKIERYRPDVIVYDYIVSQLKPVDSIKILKSLLDEVPFIIFSDVLDEEIVEQCIQAGAVDYIFKQYPARLGAVINTLVETKRVQEELKVSRERFNTLAKVSTVGIFLTTEDGFYVYVNDRWSAITGLSPEQALGEGFLNTVHLHDRKRIKTEWNRCVREKVPFYAEYRIYRESDQMEVWVLAQAMPEKLSDGTIAGFVGTITDITHLMLSEIEIDSSRKQLRALTSKLQSVREEERTYIAREIHDDLGQALTGLRMDVTWLAHKIAHNGEGIGQRLKSMIQLIDSTIHKVRKIATDLRPGILDDIGLSAAIEWYAKDVGERSGIQFSFSLDENIQLDEQRTTAFFRIFQESLTNVLRHAHAKHVYVALTLDGDTVEMLIEDDGRGITNSEITDPHSVGILGMKERAASLGGEVNIVGVPLKGTIVRVRIPRMQH